MDITFFVGNGFDIACGLKTSYTAFYKWYYGQEPSDKPCVNSFREAIKQDIEEGKENWADFEEALGQYTEKFTIDTIDEFFYCYEDARENLVRYLEEQTKEFNDALEDETEDKLKDGLINFYQDLSPRERKTFEDLFAADRGNDSRINLDLARFLCD